MAHQVFICHSSKDKAVADAACAALEAQRIPCWIAPRDVLGGTEYMEEIVAAIEEAQFMVLIFSQQANDSPQVRREIERAVHYEKILVPFRIEDVLPTRSMEFALSNTHWLDALTPPLEGKLNELCRTVLKLMERYPQKEPPLWEPKPAPVPPPPNPPAPPPMPAPVILDVRPKPLIVPKIKPAPPQQEAVGPLPDPVPPKPIAWRAAAIGAAAAAVLAIVSVVTYQKLNPAPGPIITAPVVIAADPKASPVLDSKTLEPATGWNKTLSAAVERSESAHSPAAKTDPAAGTAASHASAPARTSGQYTLTESGCRIDLAEITGLVWFSNFASSGCSVRNGTTGTVAFVSRGGGWIILHDTHAGSYLRVPDHGGTLYTSASETGPWAQSGTVKMIAYSGE